MEFVLKRMDCNINTNTDTKNIWSTFTGNISNLNDQYIISTLKRQTDAKILGGILTFCTVALYDRDIEQKVK